MPLWLKVCWIVLISLLLPAVAILATALGHGFVGM